MQVTRLTSQNKVLKEQKQKQDILFLTYKSPGISCLLSGTQTPVLFSCSAFPWVSPLFLWSKMAHYWSSFPLVGRARREVQDTALPFRNMTWKLYIAPSFVSAWPEHSHMATPTCKRGLYSRRPWVQLKIGGFVTAEEWRADLGRGLMISVTVIEWGLESGYAASPL